MDPDELMEGAEQEPQEEQEQEQQQEDPKSKPLTQAQFEEALKQFQQQPPQRQYVPQGGDTDPDEALAELLYSDPKAYIRHVRQEAAANAKAASDAAVLPILRDAFITNLGLDEDGSAFVREQLAGADVDTLRSMAGNDVVKQNLKYMAIGKAVSAKKAPYTEGAQSTRGTTPTGDVDRELNARVRALESAGFSITADQRKAMRAKIQGEKNG